MGVTETGGDHMHEHVVAAPAGTKVTLVGGWTDVALLVWDTYEGLIAITDTGDSVNVDETRRLILPGAP